MAIGETILSAVIQALIQSLVTYIFNGPNTGGEQMDIHERLRTSLLAASPMLTDAEEKQITNQAVQHWLNDLKDAVYDAEDVLDDIATEPSRPGDLKSVKLQKVTERLENLAAYTHIYGLISKEVTTTHIARLTTTPVIEERVIGRQTEMENIMRFLMAKNEDTIRKSVVAIVGIGGVGKTMVTQFLYNEKCIQERFEVKAWIHMSPKFEILNLTKTIYEVITKSSSACQFTSLDPIHDALQERLSEKKVLIVLDDMRNVTLGEWKLLRQLFASAAKGSRIIVTTRSHHIATNVGASYTHTLQPLSYVECCDLFMEQIRGAQNQDQVLDQKLVTLAGEIVDKCKGLPLAVKEFGVLLQSNRKDDYWKMILNSTIWTPPTDSTEILPVLQVSYHDLPPYLKRCFAYCSIFPKGYAFDKERVILLWMAQGFLQQAASTGRTNDRDGYFSELVSRSLFQQKSDTKFTMHDLINELAQFAAGDFCFKNENQIQEMSGKTRHLSYLRAQNNSEAMKFEVLDGVKALRTFLPLSLTDSSPICDLNKMVKDKLPSLTSLRVLSLSHYRIAMLHPDIFKNMTLVRYLDLSRTDLETLPSSVKYLYNLQTLLLSYCVNLIQLEEAICDLIKIKHLDLTATKLDQMPKNFGNLKRLETLTIFVVGPGKGAKISELKDLIELRGKLTISKLHRVGDSSEAKEANLQNKTHLKEIDFIWRTSEPLMGNIIGTHNEDAIFEMLRPSTQIEELTVEKYYGSRFPEWMSDSSFSNITCLSLTECQRCESLPSLGRLSGLKELHISKMKHLESIGPEFYSSHPEQPFKSLQTLSFEDMPNWEHWEDEQQVYGETLFPKLEELFIVNCPKLTGTLPGLFPSLTSLQIHQSAKLVFLLDANKYTEIQRLTIQTSCDSLTTLPLRYFSKLEILQITGCKIQSIQLSVADLPELSELRRLEIINCLDLTLFPQNIPPQKVEISNCPNLPPQKVEISNCPRIRS